MKRLASLLALVLISALSGGASAGDPPNIVLIVADDLGIGDVGAFGSERIKTPRLDQIASEGIVLTNFYASANICSPSRAGILTGRYPIRSGMGWDVVTAIDTHGLPLEEITIAEMLQARGYSTAMVGKWHLGNRLQFWPTRQGFDSFYGVPHSNDMPNFALYRGEQKIEQPVDQSTLTQRYTKEAVQFIKANTDRPFFLYMAHTFPHIPLFASAEFVGKSNAGLYGDAVEEIDWSTGQIVDALQKLGLYDNTLILFTSDNGAWWEGTNGASRGAKGSTWDAGYRVGLIASWPNGIPPGQASDALSINIDLLPTIADATNSELPTDRAIDGRSLLPVLADSANEPSPHPYFYYFNNEEIAGIRDGRWKLLTRAYYRRHLGALDKFDQLPEFDGPYWLLFDLADEPTERYSMAREHPEVVRRLSGEMVRAEKVFRETATRDRQKTYPR
jgi:arylsulfatase A